MKFDVNAIAERLRDWSFRTKALGSFVKALQLTPPVTALLLLCAFFFCDLAYELLAPPTEFMPPKAPPLKLVKASLPIRPFMPPPIERFAVIDERMAFLPTRRLPKTKQEIAALTLQPPNFVLVGTILGGDTPIAITRAPNATASVDVTPGQAIDGWQVVQIEATRIVLRSATGTYELKLQPPSSGAPGATPTPNQNVAPAFVPTPN